MNTIDEVNQSSEENMTGKEVMNSSKRGRKLNSMVSNKIRVQKLVSGLKKRERYGEEGEREKEERQMEKGTVNYASKRE